MKTPRQLIEALYAAQNEAARRALRAQISTRNVEYVPDQVMPEPLEFACWDEEQEIVGRRPQSEIQDLLQGGLALDLVLGGMAYNIIWRGQFVFEVYLDDVRDQVQTYDSLDDLLQAEASRPGFNLEAFVVIG